MPDLFALLSQELFLLVIALAGLPILDLYLVASVSSEWATHLAPFLTNPPLFYDTSSLSNFWASMFAASFSFDNREFNFRFFSIYLSRPHMWYLVSNRLINHRQLYNFVSVCPYCQRLGCRIVNVTGCIRLHMSRQQAHSMRPPLDSKNRIHERISDFLHGI